MTTTLTPRVSFTSAQAGNGGVTFARVLRSEWIKMTTLRSTLWSFALVVLASAGLAFLMAISYSTYGETMPAEQQRSTVVTAVTFGTFFGQLIIAVLGVLVISGEYATGMIKSTLTAVPRRLPALFAKTVVLFVTSFGVGLASALCSYAIVAPILSGEGIRASLTEPDVFMPLLASAFYLAIVAVFALGLGTIIRSSAGGIAAAVGLILILPLTFALAPVQWMAESVPYLLMSSGFADRKSVV